MARYGLEGFGRGRGRPFQKGHRTTGRAKGPRNINSKEARAFIAECARGLGGVQRMIEWAMEDPRNERDFWTMIFPRLLPVHLTGSGPHGEIELDLNVKLSREQFMKRLLEANLPTVGFGVDKPVLEVEAKRIEGNGSGNGGGQ